MEMGMRARSLAQTMFEWDNPNMSQIADVISSMLMFLTSPQIMVAGGGDRSCGPLRDGYVAAHSLPMVLCPHFFSTTDEQRIRTLVHESAHLAGIGSPNNESYCIVFDCVKGCGGFDSADSWAHYVHCLSGEKADKPDSLGARAPPGSQGQPP